MREAPDGWTILAATGRSGLPGSPGIGTGIPGRCPGRVASVSECPVGALPGREAPVRVGRFRSQDGRGSGVTSMVVRMPSRSISRRKVFPVERRGARSFSESSPKGAPPARQEPFGPQYLRWCAGSPAAERPGSPCPAAALESATSLHGAENRRALARGTGGDDLMRDRIVLRPGRATFAMAVLIAVAPVAIAEARAERTRGEALLDEIHQAYQVPQDSAYRLFRQPQPPPQPAMAGPIPEYAEAGRLVLVQDGSSPVIEIIQASIDVVDVLVVVSDSVYLDNLIRALTAVGLNENLKSGRIEILEVETESIWIRDYGPIFARDVEGEILALDSSYISRLPWSLERQYDDIVPVFLVPELGLRTLRPPLILDGGNFAADSQGHCFTSTSTLIDNAGRRDRVDEVMKTYFGCRDVTYLEPLPGPTIKHIDMFFRVASDGTYLLGEYRHVPEILSSRSWYQEEAARRMDRNLKALAAASKARGGSVRILKAPMPDIYRIDDLVNADALMDDLAADVESGDEGAQKRFDLFKKWSEESREKFYIEAQRESPPYDYPTFMNFVHLRGKKREVILLPSYSKELTEGADPATFRKILRQAYPSAEIREIDSDNLIDRQGALHCVTLVVPSIAGR